ncbi:HXXEE domain-containing protein [Bacillus glycinifermentans]|uniref:HXXEE domain-containing protein n=1 Tax=Bacillus glycinifermentans TaxID=1664069 RepID=UPI002DB76027|nr:HXXEE domain-containing protein [Bacillus glycinifermentans]MEC3606220.1 HXXEE domain-containing protein [Bacillus glycinifermentans]
MDKMQLISWLLPVLFILHDFEEMVMVEAWRNRYQSKLKQLKRVPFGHSVTTASFVCAVLEEFILGVVVTIISIYFNQYIVWFGFFFAFTVHFLVHIVLWLTFKHYVPGIWTAIFMLPFCCYLLTAAAEIEKFSFPAMILSAISGTLIVFFNLKFLHKKMGRIQERLEAYGRT